MNKVLLFVSVLFLASCSCGRDNTSFSFVHSGPQITESRSLRGFEKIEVLGSPTVYYQQADSFSVQVKGDKSAVERILTEVSGSTLTIRNKGKMGLVNVQIGGIDGHAAVYVTSPDLIGVRLSGSGDFISEKPVDTDVMDISLKGSGDIRFAKLLCDRCNVGLVGSGDANIAQLDARESDISLTGSGDINIRQQHVAATRISLRGSGDVDVEFGPECGSVDALLQGSGDIDLKGQVQRMNKEKRGSGDIDTDDLKVGN